MTAPAATTPTRVLVVGGSYAGLSTTVNLLDLGNHLPPRLASATFKHDSQVPQTPVEITIVDERDGFFHLIGSPLAFASSTYASNAWVRFQDIPALQVPNVRVLQGSVSEVDCVNKEARITNHITKEVTVHGYDFLVAASGLRRPFPVVPQSLTRKQYLLETEEHIYSVSNAPHGVIVVGGGAVGIEMAAELKLVQPNVKVTLIHSREKLLSSEGLPDDCKDKALELLREMDVEVILGQRVNEKRTDVKDGVARTEVDLSNGTTLLASEVIFAISRSVPTSGYFPPSALDDEGYVKVSPRLHLTPETPNATSHFVAGDLARWSGIKRCGTAMHMGYYAAVNIHQLMLSRVVPDYKPSFLELEPIQPMIGLAVGKKAVAAGPGTPTVFGEDILEAYFRDDLGLSICWDYLRLSTEKWKDRVLAA